MIFEVLFAMGASLAGFYLFLFPWCFREAKFSSSLISALNYLSFLAEDATRDGCGKAGEGAASQDARR